MLHVAMASGGKPNGMPVWRQVQELLEKGLTPRQVATIKGTSTQVVYQWHIAKIAKSLGISKVEYLKRLRARREREPAEAVS
jgi:hypothetical protein